MPGARSRLSTQAAPHLTEQELAATPLVLLAQPALWRSLRLPAVDAATAQDRPWAAYWATRLDARLGVAAARARYASAHAAFARQGDRIGELLTLAAIIEGFYVDEGPLDPLDAWIDALASRLPAADRWPSPEFEAHVMACGIGVRLRRPADPLLDAWAARGSVLVRQLAPGAARLKLATFLAQHALWRGEVGRAGVLVEAMPGLDIESLLPVEALMWLDAVTMYSRHAAQHERGRTAVDAALRIVRRHGLVHREYALHAHGAALAIAACDVDRAQAHVDAMRPVLDRLAQADQTHYWHYLAGLELLRGHATRAVELARMGLENSAEIGGPTRLATHQLSLGQALLCAGEPSSALPWLDGACDAARGIGSSLLSFTALLMRGACLLRLERSDDALPSIRLAWTEAARRDLHTTAVWWLADAVAQSAQAAIVNSIEPAYVRRFVRAHALAGPDALLPDWPWPLVLRGFGAFEAWRDDAPLLRAGVKAAQRPLDLLRAMLAHGPAPLPVTTVMQWLWPDSDATAQRKAFDVALLRLRRMLDDPRLLKLEGGRVWLSEQWCWSDVGALSLLMQRIGSAHGAALGDLRRWAHALLGLARGPFLAGEDSDWVVAARMRYGQRFVVTASQLATRIEPLDAAAAVELYQRALDIEPLAESLSRRLMRLHAQRGERAEALRAWRACRTMLSVAAGIGPSRETRALAAELGLPDAIE